MLFSHRRFIEKLSLSRVASIAEMEWRHRINQLQQILPQTTWLRFLGCALSPKPSHQP